MSTYYVAGLPFSSELYHHGILGQRWGVRRYQNKDGTLTSLGKQQRLAARKASKARDKEANRGIRSDYYRNPHTVPKGTIVYRMTTDANEDSSGNKYISYSDADRQHYKGGWVRYNQKADKVYEKTYELQEDLKIAGRDEVSDLIVNELKKDEALRRQTGEIFLNMAIPEGSLARYYSSIDPESGEYKESEWAKNAERFVNNFSDDVMNKPVSEAYFNAAQTLGLNKELRDRVTKQLSERGYNAMSDEASIGGQKGWDREGIDPLIVFEGAGILKETSTKAVSRGQENRSMRKYESWANKAYRNGSASWSIV